MSTSNPIKIAVPQAAGTTSWYRTPALSLEGTAYVIAGALTSGDSIIIDVSNDDALDAASVLSTDRMTSTGTATKYSSSESFSTASFSKALIGSWKWWRVRKTGSTATAAVEMR